MRASFFILKIMPWKLMSVHASRSKQLGIQTKAERKRVSGLTLLRAKRQRAQCSSCSLFREELQSAVGRWDLTHGVAAPLRESRRRRLVMDVDTVVRPLDRWGAGRCAEKTCKAGGGGRERRFVLPCHSFRYDIHLNLSCSALLRKKLTTARWWTSFSLGFVDSPLMP